MDRIPSFSIDHLRLKAGLYVSVRYSIGYETVTTFDIRLKRPYRDEVMTTGSAHALEHICATFMRNDELWKEKILYFGPMGCRTGFYLVVAGDFGTADIFPLVERTFAFAAAFEGDIPGASQIECGNCTDMDLDNAKADAALYHEVLLNAKKDNFNYPQPRKKRESKKKDE